MISFSTRTTQFVLERNVPKQWCEVSDQPAGARATHLFESSVDMLYLAATELGHTGQLIELLRSVAHHVTEKRLHILFVGQCCENRNKTTQYFSASLHVLDLISIFII